MTRGDAQGEALGDPFASLGERGTFSRVLLGELRGPRNHPIFQVAIKLQSDEYPLAADGGGTGLTNEDVEASWGREAALLDRYATPGSGLTAPVDVLDREPETPALLPPTLYCKRLDAFFPAPCPGCATTLRDVRDDRRLEDRRLPRRDRSLARFVACPNCLERGAGKLWTLVRDAEHSPDVGDQSDLYVSFGRLAREPGDALPCQRCEHVPGCYPDQGSGDVLRHLVPVSFYESRALALPVLPLRWVDALRLIRGEPLVGLGARVEESGRADVLDRLDGALHGQEAWLFRHDVAGKLGLERFRLVLGLFAQLCRAVAGYHRHTRSPHLGIGPDRVLIGLDPEPSALPWLWRLGVRLAGLGNARKRGEAFLRPHLVTPVFAAPAMREAALAGIAAVATPTKVFPQGDGRVVVDLTLESDAVDLGQVTRADAIDVVVAQGRPPLALELATTPIGIEGRRVTVRSAPVAVDAVVRDTLAGVVGHPLARTRITITPCLHVPADVYGLGMMLLTSLLGGSRGDAEIDAIVTDLRRRFSLVARGAGDGDEAVLLEQAARLVTIPELARPAGDDAPEASVPDALWTEALLIGLRAVTMQRGFSICRDGADFDPSHPEVKAEFLAQLVDSLVRRVDAALFGLPGRRDELRAAIARVARGMEVD